MSDSPTVQGDSAKASDKKLHPSVRFAPLLAELAKLEEMPLSERGAALLIAHAISELGRGKVQAMKPGEISAYLKSFRSKCPLAGQALDVCDVVRFVYNLGMFSIEHDDENEYRRMLLEILPPPAKVTQVNLG